MPLKSKRGKRLENIFVAFIRRVRLYAFSRETDVYRAHDKRVLSGGVRELNTSVNQRFPTSLWASRCIIWFSTTRVKYRKIKNVAVK